MFFPISAAAIVAGFLVGGSAPAQAQQIQAQQVQFRSLTSCRIRAAVRAPVRPHARTLNTPKPLQLPA
jgi:hypothetical protein